MIENVCVIIPAYNPDEKIFLEFIEKLNKEFSKILVVNDGSSEECASVFKKIEEMNIKLVKHSVNLGKGRALKTAFNEVLNTYPECIGSVCADCDGQHSIEDIKKCVHELENNKNSLIIGARDFNKSNVPARSKFGNKITRGIFKIFIGLSITDTQTGLRAISNNLMRLFMNVKGERYEYETNMLIECKNQDINIVEVPINTIYIEENRTSKFNPIKDSISIYKMFAKYIFSAVSSFVIDIALFKLFLMIFNNANLVNSIICSTIISRIISSLYNFIINGKVVFKNINKSSLIKYVILVIVQMFVSAFAVEYLSKIIKINTVIIKIFVDAVIFMVNFVVQREFVFKK